MDFINVDRYMNLLKKAENIICVKDYRNHNRGLILRHDVDESLDFAYEIYEIEKHHELKSTFYILLTSDLYNPFTLKNRVKLREMADNGFEVGLHFDPMAYDGGTLIDNFKNEIEMFEKYLGIKLHSYSMHNPSITGEYVKYPKLIDAYGAEIFSDNCYISDSTFSFRGKSLEEYIEKSNHQLIQLLIHADHLMSDGEISYQKPIKKMLENYLKKIDDTYFVNSIYKEERADILNLLR